ncbi:hypothetical protein LG202_13890 [Methylobacillus methanolivorans]
MKNFSWRCPYCNHNATITEDHYSSEMHWFKHNNRYGAMGFISEIITCPNDACKEFTVMATLSKVTHNGTRWVAKDKPFFHSLLKPQSAAKPFPDYIPIQIIQDYQEACAIVELSPKASATLSRRCLQGIIRDFWKISKSRLVDEIEALNGKVDEATWHAIDSVRKIGNIGAHMEKNIDLIIDVDPEEARMLIGLIEVLLAEWYIHRHEREEQMSRIVQIAQEKQSVKPDPTFTKA